MPSAADFRNLIGKDEAADRELRGSRSVGLCQQFESLLRLTPSKADGRGLSPRLSAPS
jgi:hypothetical protein